MKIKDLKAGEAERLWPRISFTRSQLESQVAAIVEDVAARGDEALIDYTARFDQVELSPDRLRLTAAELDKAARLVSTEINDALATAAARVRRYHEQERRTSWSLQEDGARLGQKVVPLRRVGVYIPGGRAAYPSSVLMNVIPAQVAGVQEIALCTPPDNNGGVSPYVAAAARLLKVDEVYRVGGAQAVAAMAYGTASLPPVDKITGPGNIYVTLAKKLVLGQTGIDMLAGPSEILIIADTTAEPDFIAADLLAQAEHDPQAKTALVTTSRTLAQATAAALDKQILELNRQEIIREALEANGQILIVPNINTAIAVANRTAPEHLEIITADAPAVLARIENAGSVFLGNYTPVALGDYIAGGNHVLPTGGTARFFSPLGVDDFVKKIGWLEFSAAATGRLSAKAQALAEIEGLTAHAQALKIRNNKGA